MKNNNTLGWGVITNEGVELWDAEPVFCGEKVSIKDKLKLIFYPKKFLLYTSIAKAKRKAGKKRNLHKEPFRILDVGCGTGATIIDLKKLFGREVEVVGLDVIKIQLELAKKKIKQHGIWPKLKWYDGSNLPFGNKTFDAIYTSDVLGHVEDVPTWLKELRNVLKPEGTLAMFSESKLGKHAYIRNYLINRGLNTDPHAEFHISLYSKAELQDILQEAGFEIDKMYSSFWAKFFVHPDELYPQLQNQNKFLILKTINKLLYTLKKKTHPYSTALAELYGLLEMVTLGRKLESQGYVILAKRKRR